MGYADDAKYYKFMDIVTRICFIQKSFQFNEYTLHDIHLDEEEGITAQPTPFAYDDVSIDVSDSKSEEED